MATSLFDHDPRLYVSPETAREMEAQRRAFLDQRNSMRLSGLQGTAQAYGQQLGRAAPEPKTCNPIPQPDIADVRLLLDDL